MVGLGLTTKNGKTGPTIVGQSLLKKKRVQINNFSYTINIKLGRKISPTPTSQWYFFRRLRQVSMGFKRISFLLNAMPLQQIC